MQATLSLITSPPHPPPLRAHHEMDGIIGHEVSCVHHLVPRNSRFPYATVVVDQDLHVYIGPRLLPLLPITS